MGLLDALSFKKKKTAPLKELELPPPANEALATGYNELEDMPPYREIETPQSSQLQRFPIPFESFMQKEEHPSFHQEDFSAPLTFDKPREPTPIPSGLSDIPSDMPPIPLPFEREMRMKEDQQRVQQQQTQQDHGEQLSLFSDIPQQQTPQFRFYEAPTEEHEEAHEIHEEQHPLDQTPADIDIAKELLAVPKEQKPVIKQPKKEINVTNKKQFLPITTLGEIGEQLFHLQDDLTLAKDTAFRVTDLNEQEIEQLAKWQTVCTSMELKIAEMDKMLFKV